MSRSTPAITVRRRAFLLALGTLPACAGAPIRLDIFPARGASVRAVVGPLTLPAASPSAGRVLATADRYVGTRYRYGGESPAEGFDCSGFVQYVFARHGVELPRTSAQQAGAGRAVSGTGGALQPGDLMFFDTEGHGVDHVAIYAGGGRLIHAASGAGRVRYDDVDTDRGRWLLERLVASRRVLAAGAT
jgi:cell wall-associated NlpC family hydrolase